MLVARDALCEDPGMSVTKEDAAARLGHAKALECRPGVEGGG